ncbi:MAG: Spx/MgsR family RNA polymerase-binding regulatory protein [Balneola sp.]|nr:Spx/MgsR family RNA polymerase-binding regulatory protein [Balneola sp.]MBO6651736.1 Spx/MgsR family RNA polymerase-binding regulatory protein [Balneola sp.]MBO6711084.1 Spx/MgsR family RNA polymerase-binding regulatory protein [Balneola sp.]MBO6800802.1 Spx/MgsR family RNA polymerase-binding regulatory protein [Balneola sp.]MBO6869019.1 Spx/MgsR family RNA polymerase-binding regulatory protein [Balneola sp.]
MLHVIGIKNCDTIKKTKKWLTENEVEFEFIDLKKEPLSIDEIKELEYKVGLDVLVNKRGTTYRNLGLKDRDLSDEEMVGILQENQSMIKRPVLVLDEAVLVGYDKEAFKNFVGLEDLEDSPEV